MINLKDGNYDYEFMFRIFKYKLSCNNIKYTQHKIYSFDRFEKYFSLIKNQTCDEINL